MTTVTDLTYKRMKLTYRQRQILSLMANGVDNDVIAVRLGYSYRTIKGEVSKIYRIMHLDPYTTAKGSNRAAAVAIALRAGIIE